MLQSGFVTTIPIAGGMSQIDTWIASSDVNEFNYIV
jgi:hypothetical protein